MKKIFTFLCCLLCFIANAQNVECGIIDTADSDFDHIAFEKYMSHHLQNGLNKFNDKDTISIVAHILRSNAGITNITINEIVNEVKHLNAQWEVSGIFFEVCDQVNYIDNNQYADLDADEKRQLAEVFNVYGAINIFFAENLFRILDGERQNLCGISTYPWSSDPETHSILMKNSCSTNGSTLSHELGHFFGLLHTHSSFYGTELVNGSNCSDAGDTFCDTPADPTLSSIDVTSDCFYIGNEFDSNGEIYNPDTRNIMSYSRKSCRVKLSKEQSILTAYYKDADRAYLLGDACSLSDLTIEEDLVIESYQGAEIINKDIWVINNSRTSVPSCTLETAIYNSNDILVEEPKQYEIQQIPGNGQVRKEIEFELPIHLSSGDYYMKHTIDYHDEIIETNEENNIVKDAFEIDNSNLNDFVIYPSSANSTIRIFLRDEFRSTHFLKVYNTNGQLFFDQKFNKSDQEYHNEYNISKGLGTGIYLVTVWNAQYEEVKSVKFFIP